jgi:hypothetical protein
MKIPNIYKYIQKSPILPVSLNDTDCKINMNTKYSNNIHTLIKHDKFNKQLIMMEEGRIKHNYVIVNKKYNYNP